MNSRADVFYKKNIGAGIYVKRTNYGKYQAINLGCTLEHFTLVNIKTLVVQIFCNSPIYANFGLYSFTIWRLIRHKQFLLF